MASTITSTRLVSRRHALKTPSAPAKGAERRAPEPMDFSVLDQSEEAVLLPLLDPAFQLALQSCLKEQLSGEPSAREESYIRYDSQFGELKMEQSFELETSEDGRSVSLTGGGSVNGEKAFDAGTVKSQSGSWWGGYGANTYNLDMIKGPTGYHIWGSLGQLECRLRLVETESGFLTQGQIGGRDFHQSVQSGPQGHQAMGRLQAESFGEPPDQFRRHYTRSQASDTKETIRGGGEIFSQTQSSEVLISEEPFEQA